MKGELFFVCKRRRCRAQHKSLNIFLMLGEMKNTNESTKREEIKHIGRHEGVQRGQDGLVPEIGNGIDCNKGGREKKD